jgi:N-acetyl-anhydromuramyl-L-alanine amidase AmpD
MPARWATRGRPFLSMPTMVVLHSGATGPDVASYLAHCPDGRQVSAHFSWHPASAAFVQQVALTRTAWHAGKTTNATSIGIELSGPWHQCPRDPVELAALSRLLADLRAAMPSLAYWVRHSDINANKSDPGLGLPDELPEGVGLVHV